MAATDDAGDAENVILEPTTKRNRDEEEADVEAGEDDLGPMVGPAMPKAKKKKKLEFEKVYLNALPSAEM